MTTRKHFQTDSKNYRLVLQSLPSTSSGQMNNSNNIMDKLAASAYRPSSASAEDTETVTSAADLVDSIQRAAFRRRFDGRDGQEQDRSGTARAQIIEG